jgi:5-methylcytosine-specific restriction endonuclease McrA
MKPYTKTYMKYFGYDTSDFIPCEICGNNASDIHHLEPRSIAKAKENFIDNLMALCRNCHDECGKNRAMNETAKLIHRKKLLQVRTDHETEKYL